MLRSDLIQHMEGLAGGGRSEPGEQAVRALFEVMASHLEQGGRIEIRGLGSFWTEPTASRVSRNPKTGARIMVDARRKVRFRAGKSYKKLTPRT